VSTSGTLAVAMGMGTNSLYNLKRYAVRILQTNIRKSRQKSGDAILSDFDYQLVNFIIALLTHKS